MERRQVIMLLVYVAFVAWAITQLPGTIKADFAPPRLHSVLALDLTTENSIFLGCFLLIGVTQAALVGLYLQAAEKQSLDTRFFSVTGFFFGFYVSGLYQALRKRVTRVAHADLKVFDQRAVESRLFGVVMLLAGVASYALAAGAFGRVAGTFVEELHGLVAAVMTDRLVAAVVADLAISTVLLADPLMEDMARRDISFSGGRFLAFCTYLLVCTVPGVGLGVYLTFRPRLPAADRDTTKVN